MTKIYELFLITTGLFLIIFGSLLVYIGKS
jgi:glucose dehydrogenase